MSLFEGVFTQEENGQDSLFSKDSKFYIENQKQQTSKHLKTKDKKIKKAKKGEKQIQNLNDAELAQQTKTKKKKNKMKDQDETEEQDQKIILKRKKTKKKISEDSSTLDANGEEDQQCDIPKKRKKVRNVEDLYEVQAGKVKKKKIEKVEKVEEEDEGDEGDIEEMMKDVQTGGKMMGNESDEEEVKKNTQRQRSENRSPEQQSCTIYVGNLPANIKRQQLRQLFQDCVGDVESLRFRGIAILSSCTKPMEQAVQSSQFINKEHTSKDAYVVFVDKSSVDKAKQYNMRVLWGHHLQVKPYFGLELDNQRSVFIANLAQDVQDEEVIQLFHGDQVGEEHKGKVTGYRLIRDHRTRASKGVGFVEFKNKSTAKAIIELDNQFTLRGKKVRIHKVKNTYKTSQSQNSEWAPQNAGKQSWQGVQTKGAKDKQVRGVTRKELSAGNRKGGPQKKVRTGKRPAVAERKRQQLKLKALLKDS